MGELVLLVGVPIVAAALAVTLRGRTVAPRTLALLVLSLQSALAVVFSARAIAQGDGTRQVLGGFTAPFGIEVVLDGVSALVVVLIALVAYAIVVNIQPGARTGSFYALTLLLVAGLTGVALAGDLFNLYVFLEISGLAVYGLVASGRGGEGALSALKYLIVGTVGATLYLLGVAYLYAVTGTLNMADMTQRIPEVAGFASTPVVTAFGLVVVGLAVKIAIFPLHAWQPDAYADAPDDVTALMAALVSTTAAYALLRVVFDAFTVEFLTANPFLHEALLILVAVSVLAGGVFAYRQRDVKRMLAYSSVSQFGLVIIGLLLATQTAVYGSILHLIGHAVMKAGLFLAVGILAATVGVRTVDGYAGLSQRSPFVAGAFAVLALALVGVPPAVGFVGKWYIALGAIEAGRWGMLAVVMASTLITLAYVLRLLERIYVRDPPPREDRPPARQVAVEDLADETAKRPPLAGPLGPLMPTAVPVIAAAAAAVALGLAGPWVQDAIAPALEVLLRP